MRPPAATEWRNYMNNPIRDQYKDLHISLHSTGNTKMPNLHYHDSYEIYALEAGERLYLIEDKFIHLKPRDVILIKPGIVHCTLGGDFVRSLLLFRKEFLDGFFNEKGVDLITQCFEKSVIRVKDGDFLHLIELMEKFNADRSDVFAFTEILSVLKSNMMQKDYDLHRGNPKINDIIDYITENYKTIDSLDTLSNKFYISKHYLCNLFKEHTNTSIIKYINILKIHEAMELLSKNDLTVFEVAEKSGFTSVSNFCNVFKKFTGKSPLKYSKTEIPNRNK